MQMHSCFSLLRVELCTSYRRPIRTFGLLAQREVHVDLSYDLDRLSVEKGRLVHPLFHRLKCGRDQQRVAADHLEFLNGAVLGNDGTELYDSRNARLLGQRRIDGMRLADQLGLLHTAADLDAGRGGGLVFPLWGGGGGGAAVGTEPMMPPSTPPIVPPATPPGTPPTTPDTPEVGGGSSSSLMVATSLGMILGAINLPASN